MNRIPTAASTPDIDRALALAAQVPPHILPPTVGEMDLHLLAEGRHEELWRVLGARVITMTIQGYPVPGVAFAVWAPNARSVQVVGDFNDWDGCGHVMRNLGGSGVWELFIPGLAAGALYKYAIHTCHGDWVTKADPMARQAELPPATASVVTDSHYTWHDQEWLDQRAQRPPHASAISIYEVHLPSWKQGLTYQDLATDLVDYVKDLGFTHVEFMPVAEHPFTGSWGYQVTGYYAPTSRLGSPDDFKHLVDAFHQAGIGVIMDWVPAHFPKDDWALARFDGTCLYEHPDPQRGEHADWGTYIFDFGRPQVRSFLIANALYWLEEFHIDGLRVDAVASMLYLDYSRPHGAWTPNHDGGRENLEAMSLMQELNATAYRRNPGIFIAAEESTSWPGVTSPTSTGGLGFGFKWNMGWMNDSLHYLATNPLFRNDHHHCMTFASSYAYSEHFILPISHDEVVHGKHSLVAKAPGDWWQQRANVRAFLGFMWAHPGKKLLFMGSEFAQWHEWNHDASLTWELLDHDDHRGMRRTVQRLNEIYQHTPALWELDGEPGGFEWVNADDAAHNVYGFVRWDRAGRPLVCLTNMSGVPWWGYQVRVPAGHTWHEVINTDHHIYGGAGEVTNQPLESFDNGCGPCVSVNLPALSTVWLRPTQN